MNYRYVHSEQLSIHMTGGSRVDEYTFLSWCEILVRYVGTDIYGKPVYSFVRSRLPFTLTYSRSCKLHVL